MKLRLMSIAAAALFVLSCQAGDDAVAAPKRGDVPEISTLYGDYLAASYAHEIDDAEARQKYFTRAYEQSPNDTRIGRRAMVAAIEMGDMDAAVDIAEDVYDADKTESLARAVLGVNAFRKGRNDRAAKYFSGPTDDLTMTILMQLVRGWIEVDEDELVDAAERFTALGGGDYFSAFGKLQVAKMHIRQGQYDKADEVLNEVESAGLSTVEVALTRARGHVLNNRPKDALEALNTLLDENDGLSIGPIGEYARIIEAGGKLPEISMKAEVARALTDPSWGFFARNRSMDGAEIYLRFARWVDPSYGKAAMWLGSMLEDGDKLAQEQAYAMYRDIPDTNPYYTSAQLNIANIYFNWERDDEAIKTLEALNEREQSLLTRESLGRARFFRENYEEALPFYKDLVDSMSDAEIEENVEPLRFRGIIYERLDRWAEAEADFKRVLKFAPDDVDTLNYLGYTWVDRGENLTEAFDMIRKAVDKQPQSGAIVDSLGWAHYKLGQYSEAKIKLEDAVALSPSSATIIDHLGDVYWKLGRKREAGFQWKRALEFDPTDDERATIEVKLKGGLEAVQALP